MRVRSTLILFLLSGWAFDAAALPPVQSDRDTVDDATLTLRVLDQVITGDTRSWCEVQIVVVGEDVPLRAGDTVLLWVYEDDVAGDDELWAADFQVTAQEAANQRVDRTLNCSANFGDDPGDNLELYADARVEKDECSGFCRWDRPTTGDLEVAEVNDDDAEQDDARNDARPTPIGRTGGRIARDQDWFQMSLLDRSLITFEVQHRPDVGRVEAVLFGPDGERILAGRDDDAATVLESAPLAPGDYFVRVGPRDGNDFNFYDVVFRLQTGGCNPGAIEAEPCGNCGQRRRTCNDDGQWGEFGECENEGACAPGDERMMGCGNCGSELQNCSDQCFWEPGACGNEGECRAGDSQSEACDEGGSRERLCDDTCRWGAYGACMGGGECEPEAERDCYDGPPGSSGVGECARGTQRCGGDGAWGECADQVLPAAEMCEDGLDNDCDGTTDGDDDDCADGEAEVGDACDGRVDCDPFDCLRDDAWRDGYCTADCDDCPDDAVCGTVFGQPRCLRGCAQGVDCRPGYLCADVAADELACIPGCRSDEDCADPELPRCDVDSRLCIPAAPGLPDMGVEPDMGGAGGVGGGAGAGGAGGGFGGGGGVGGGFEEPRDAGTAPGATEGETAEAACSGCSAGAPSSAPIWLLLGLLGLRRRRTP